MSRDSSVNIATVYELESLGSIPSTGKKFSSSPQRPDRLWGPISLLSSRYMRLFPLVKWPGREADYSPQPIAEIKNGRAIRSLPHTSSLHGDVDNIIVELHNDWWTENWKEFGRKLSWSYRGTLSTFYYRDWGKPWNTSVKIDVWTEHLANAAW
jgi:hypothetical protein